MRQKWHNDILYRIQRHDDVVTKIMDKQEKDKNEILGAYHFTNDFVKKPILIDEILS